MKIKNSIKSYLVNCTGGVCEGNIPFAILEVAAFGKSVANSLSCRLTATTLIFLGLGQLYESGRQVSRKLFHVKSNSPEWVQTTHDFLYSGVFGGVMTAPIYTIGGFISGQPHQNPLYKECMIAGSISAMNGPFVGYSIDACRDLAGIQESERPAYPDLLKKRSSPVKKAIFGGFILASLGINALTYSLTPERPNKEQQTIQQIENAETLEQKL